MAPISGSASRISVKLYPAGKCFISSAGAPQYAEEAAAAFRRSLRVQLTIANDVFCSYMRAQGVPDEVIHRYLAGATIEDETYLSSEWQR